MKRKSIAAFVLLNLLIGQSIAQGLSDLDKLDQKLVRYFEKAMPGWKHERVEPVTKGENVLIQFWSFSNRKVKVSVLPHKSAGEAREILQRHVRYTFNKQELSDVGDEAYAGGYGSADITFRKGRFTVYISTYADVDSDSEARTLSQQGRFEREKNEMRRWSREFAKHVANAVDSP